MTSTPEDGDFVRQDAGQPDTQTDLQNETVRQINVISSSRNGEDLEQELDQPDDIPLIDGGDLKQDTQEINRTEEIPNQQEQDTDELPEADTLPDSIPDASVHNRPASVAESASVPDDTPSVQRSLQSIPPSQSPTIQSPVSKKGSTPRRPFDLRFQSRLSSYSPGTSPRPSSPAFLASHSRQSSLASFAYLSASEPDDLAAPWDVIRWHKLNRLSGHLFAEISRRNLGIPTCLAVADQIVIGTSKGIVLVFDHQQSHKAIIGQGTHAMECGTVVSLAVSADHTTVAAGHATGHIFTWEITKASRPFLHIPPIANAHSAARKGDGHVPGSAVLHIGFLGFRRTALVSADDRGMAFSHLATRGTGAIGRAVRTTRILGRYPDLIVRGPRAVKKSSVLAFAPLPLGNIEKSTDSLGLVAMLTPYLLVIVSTTPIAQTQHKAARPKDITAHSAMTAALAWFPAIKLKGSENIESRSKLVYAWSDVLTVLEIHELPVTDDGSEEKQPELQFLPRSRYRAEEAIVAVQWLSRSVIAVLTITQQLLIVEDVTMTVTDSFDLLPKDIFHSDVYSHQLTDVVEDHNDADTSIHGVVADAYYMSFRTYKGRLFLLGSKSVWWGALTNWADRLLVLMHNGDLIGAIRLATIYFVGVGEKSTIGLPEDDNIRAELVREKLLEIMSASLRYAFVKNQTTDSRPFDQTELLDLAVVCVAACLSIDNKDFMFDELFSWYDDHGQGAIFVDVLEPHILDGKIVSLPPTVLQVLINRYKSTHTSSTLEEIICLLDPRMMDIDQVTSLCKQHKLYDAYIYVWNTALQDFVSPLDEMVQTARSTTLNGDLATPQPDSTFSHKMFAYLSFILTGRIYPTGSYLEANIASIAKSQVYDFLLSSGRVEGRSPTTKRNQNPANAVTFPKLRTILSYDCPSFMAALNEAFEDNFLNTGVDDDSDELEYSTSGANVYNRRLIVQILLDVMSVGFDDSDRIYLDMFIARNLPKYPQYMLLLSGTILRETLLRLCQYQDEEVRDDAQLSVEYLLSVYHPSDALALVPLLRQAHFFRVLKFVYKQEQQYADLLDTYFLDPEDQIGIFGVIVDCLNEGSSLTVQEKSEVCDRVLLHAPQLIDIDVRRAVSVISQVMPKQHAYFVQSQADAPGSQFQYLRALFEPEGSSGIPEGSDMSPLIELYLRLMCQYAPDHVVEYVKTVREVDLELDSLVPAMESSGAVDAAVILLTKQGQAHTAMSRLIRHIATLQTALRGVLESVQNSPDIDSSTEAIRDLLASIDKYSLVGVWLCQTQSKSGQRSRLVPKSTRQSAATTPLSPDETLWIDLLSAIVAVAQGLALARSDKPKSHATIEEDVQISIRNSVQNAFTALLTSTTAAKHEPRIGSDFTFLRILRAFLTRAAESSPSLAALRSVISSIFSAYSYEAAILSLSNSMLDKDLFVHVDEVTKRRQEGWRPRGQICEICRKRAWGSGIGVEVWDRWKGQEVQNRGKRRNAAEVSASALGVGSLDDLDSSVGKGKANANAACGTESAGPSKGKARTAEEVAESKENVEAPKALVVFSCRHLFHRQCLEREQRGTDLHDEQGQDDAGTPYRCLSCH